MSDYAQLLDAVIKDLEDRKALGARLVVAGDGECAEEARTLAQSIAPDRIEFVGYQSGEELRNLVSESTLSIQAPEWYENGPLSLLESLAAGVPVVAADIGGLPEMIRPGETGELFPSGDSHALAKAVANLLADPDRLREMSTAARLDATERFNAQAHLKRLIDYYNEAGENKPVV